MKYRVSYQEGQHLGRHCYKFSVVWRDFSREVHEYLDYRDETLREMKKWCTDNFGIISWHWHTFEEMDFTIFIFNKPDHAMMFKLRFG
ncbi:hypothetical protein D3C87_666610 [compost metagenome]